MTKDNGEEFKRPILRTYKDSNKHYKTSANNYSNN